MHGVYTAYLLGDPGATKIVEDMAAKERCARSGHDWIKPDPRPADHKYECSKCGHYDLDDYE